jgi:hypothetical protein
MNGEVRGAIRLAALSAMAAWALLLLAAACTEVTKTVLARQHPALEDLGGTYAAAWSSDSGTELLGIAKVEASDFSISFSPYPCFLVLGQEALGGGFDYSQGAGQFAADLKSLGGDLVLTVEGAFPGPGLDFAGVYRAEFNGVTCDTGTITMRGD